MTRTASAARPRRDRSHLLHAAAASGAGVVLLIISAFGGTYAHWADTEQLDLGTITAGSLTLTVNDATSVVLPDERFEGMLPGDRVRTPLELTTEGDVDTTMTVSGTLVGDGGHQVAITTADAAGLCPADVVDPAAVTVVPQAEDIGSWEAGESRTVCLDVILPDDVGADAAGEHTTIALTFVASQVVS